ncbi:MAG: flagellar filament capping protein FliD [Donghicola eburneus]|nr:flagellar filament capping protein FliD [Donghicola eburneus]MCI5041798.1 flagellar filament capping protein FliD [Donghicola eburneus]
MVTDIISTLNTGGSGLNITQLAEDLTNAEYSVKKSIVQDRSDSAELSMTAIDRLKSQFTALQGSVENAASASATAISSDSAAIVLTAEQADQLRPGTTTIEVEQMAQPQVLAFGGFTGLTEELKAGTLTIEFGAWDDATPSAFTADAARTAETLNITEGMTLSDLAEQLTALEGTAAQVIDIGDGTFSLGVLADYGLNNAIRITATDDPAATTGTSLAALDMTDQVEDVQMQAASNAQFTVNGIAITRASNEVDDVIPGVSFNIAGYTGVPATVTVAVDTEAAKSAMQNLVDAFNTSIRLVDELGSRGFNGSEKGDLAGDPAISTLQRQMESLIANGIEGFGERPLYLADIGVRTERDGSLSLDMNVLEKAMEENPEIFEAIMRDGVKSNTAGVTVSGDPSASAAAGRYTVTRDPITGEASIDGINMSNKGTDDDGMTTYVMNIGPLKGLTITMEAAIETATFDFGRSFTSAAGKQIEDWLSNNGTLARREDVFADQITDASIELEDLDADADARKSYYLTRFTQMEMIVTQLNSTGDYLTSLVDAWNAQD